MRAHDRLGTTPADLLAAIGLTGLGVWMSVATGGAAWLDTLVAPAATLPVLWRRRAPALSAAALAVGVVVSALPTFDQARCGVAIPAALLVLFSLATRAPRGAAVPGLLLVLAGMVVLSVTDPLIDPAALGFVVPLCAGVWGAGRVVRSRDALAARLVERTGQLERQRARTARLAVEVERTRLAAQLDLAARRRVGEIVALARRGEALPPGDPEGTRALCAEIERTGRASLDEMRGLLGALRTDGSRGHAPRPTLAQLDALLSAVQAAGDAARLDVEGERRPLPEGVELAAYRIVEHALGAAEGRGGEPVTVRLRYLPDRLELEVSAPGDGDAGDAALLLAQERATTHGGTLSLQPGTGGRAVVRARFPVAPARA